MIKIRTDLALEAREIIEESNDSSEIPKTAIRRFDEAVTAGNVEEATARFQYAQKRIYQVASKGTIHKNAAARKVAKLAQKLNAMNA